MNATRGRAALLAFGVLVAVSWASPGWAAPASGRPTRIVLDAAGADTYRIDPLIPGPNGELPTGWVQTQWGALGPVDRTLVETVRRADLWEGPAGQMAVEKGASPRVRQIGAMISSQHVKEIDPLVVKVGAQLGITLPAEPTQEQQGWLAEMRQATGADFDQIFVARLRAAHAKVFTLIATVRANTRNSVVRDFAQAANKYVDGHISMLDSTDLVAFNALPTPAAPVAAVSATRADGLTASGGLNPVVIWTVLAVALLAGAAAAVRVIRPRTG